MDRRNLVVRLRKLFGVCCQCISYCPADGPVSVCRCSSAAVLSLCHVQVNTISIRLGFAVTPRQFVLYRVVESSSSHVSDDGRSARHRTSPPVSGRIQFSFVNVTVRVTSMRRQNDPDVHLPRYSHSLPLLQRKKTYY